MTAVVIGIFVLIFTAPPELIYHPYCEKVLSDRTLKEAVLCIKDNVLWTYALKVVSSFASSKTHDIAEMTMKDWAHFVYLIVVVVPAFLTSTFLFCRGAGRIHKLLIAKSHFYTENDKHSYRYPIAWYLVLIGVFIFIFEYPNSTSSLDDELNYFYVTGVWFTLVGLSVFAAKKIWGREED